jgi:NHLM bacteriocin system ABC transporter ATP-binding protein
MPENNDQLVANAVVQMASIFESETENFNVEDGELLWLSCQQVAKYLGFTLIKPTHSLAQKTNHAFLLAMAKTSHFRIRTVVLNGAWWETDNGPLIVFDKITQKPYTLIPQKSGQYQVFYPETQQFKSFTPEFSEQLSPRAYSFYRIFPDKKLKVADVFLFALRGQKSDITRLLLAQVFIGLLGLFVPIATGIILDTAVPNANLGILWQFIFGLFASSFAIASFTVAQTFAVIRLGFKTEAALQPAVWDRLLRLPTNFFHQFNPGDLSLRASGIDTMQQKLTGASLQFFLSGIFSFITLGLMFYYSPILAASSIVLALIIVSLITISNIILLKYQRPILKLQGKLANLSFEFITSISKLRASNSEARAFSIWAEQFSKKNHLIWLSSRWSIYFVMMRGILSILIFMWLYIMVGTNMVPISLGVFIAFNAALSQFISALLGLAGEFANSIALIPLYERIQPILHELPEKEKEGIELKELSGKIELRDITFRYNNESSPVLENISFKVKEGEFIALTGPTGCGKSTIFRLLIGFETPTHGHIYYNDQKLEKLNVRLLREQLGVVLQNSMLLSGTILENITGLHSQSLDDAWEAAKLACFAKDIEDMPMGMHTLLVEGGKTISVGQRQRLLIARALARKPRILLFDEATSALDNPTQAQIMHNIESLKITRIVVAHRLSTLINADQIYVIANGQIVQAGKYATLLAQGGLFADLVHKQMLSKDSF